MNRDVIEYVDPLFLRRASAIYYMDPGFALWRGMELALISQTSFEGPVLDVGCGDGLFAFLLFLDGKTLGDGFDDYSFYHLDSLPDTDCMTTRPDLIGLDIDGRAVRKANKLSVHSSVLVGDACRVPYRENKFGTVYSNCVVEHICAIDDVLGEVARVLKPGGKFVFTVPSRAFGANLFVSVILRSLGFGDAAAKYARSRNDRLQHFNLFGPDEWREKLADAGLRLSLHRYYLTAGAELAWDILFLVNEFGVDRYRVGKVAGRFASSTLARKIKLPKKLLVGAILRFLSRYFKTAADRGGGLLLLAEKPGDTYGVSE